MKIAIQLFGHLRSFRDTFPYLKENIIKQYDCDVFMHTWSNEEHSDPSWHKNDYNSPSIKKTNPEEVNSLYQPKKLSIEDNAIIKQEGFFNQNQNITLRGLKSMCYSQYSVNNLRLEYEKESNSSYDLVIMIRPDVMPLAILDTMLFSKEFDFNLNTSIHFSNESHNFKKDSKYIYTPLASDIFFVSKPEPMSKIVEAYTDFNRFYIAFSKINSNNISAPEASFIENIHQKSIIPRFYLFPYIVKRTQGENHIKVALDQIKNHKLSIAPPDFIEKGNEIKRPYRILSILSDKNLNKFQKQLYRVIRSINNTINTIEKIKNTKR